MILFFSYGVFSSSNNSNCPISLSNFVLALLLLFDVAVDVVVPALVDVDVVVELIVVIVVVGDEGDDESSTFEIFAISHSVYKKRNR